MTTDQQVESPQRPDKEDKDQKRIATLVKIKRLERKANQRLAVEDAPKLLLVFDGDEPLAPTEYLVQEIIPVEGAGMLFGETDLGKTFVAVDIAVHVAAGLPWMGHEVTKGTVLFVESEGGRAFALRKHAAKGAAGLGDGTQGDLFKSLPFVSIYQPLAFGPDTDVAVALDLANLIRKQVADRGLPPIRLVVVDTLAQNLKGNADSNEDMSGFLQLLRAFLKALSDEPVFGIIIHHPGHKEKGRGRGAYQTEADLDLVMELQGNKQDLDRTLYCKRMRDGDRFADIPLRLEKCDITVNGEPLKDSRGCRQTSLVVLPREAKPSEKPKVDEIRAATLQALPGDDEPAVGLNSVIWPKVESILGRKCSKNTVQVRLYTLEREGLAEQCPGRTTTNVRWRMAKLKEGEF